MATVVDAARDADTAKNCASPRDWTSTERNFPRAFTLLASVADPTIPTDGTAPAAATVAVPEFVDFSGFWYPAIHGTTRF